MNGRRYIGLDVGDKTIGVAVSDLLGLTAQPITTIRRASETADFERLQKMAKEYETTSFVVGLPKNMNGSEGARAKLVREFAEKLKVNLPGAAVDFWDERLTTVAAHRLLIEGDMSRRKRKKVVDKMAAVLILEGYLEKCQNMEDL